MPRFIPLNAMGSQAGSGVPSGGGFDWTDLGRFLKPAGALANLGGFGDVGSALGGLGGLFNFGSGIASGNPAQAVSGAIGAGNTASGLLGGPTIGSAISSVAPGLSAFVPGVAASAALAPFAMMAMGGLNAALTGGGDLFDGLFGEPNGQAVRQIREHKQYAEEFPSLVGRRTAGANLFDDLDEYQTPESIEDALRTAESGVRATRLAPAYDHLVQAPNNHKSSFAADIPGMDLSWWAERAPDLEGRNWSSYIRLLDKSGQAGLDPESVVGDFDRQVNLGGGSGMFTLPNGDVIDHAQAAAAGYTQPGYSSQIANDLSQAIAGIGGQLGIDWASRGPDGTSQGYQINDDQLDDLGFTGGNYMTAIGEYLKRLQPDVEQHENWGRYFG